MELLEKHFDTAFDAPDGIEKLRELILTLAMKGQLVLQNSSEQPALYLFKEIEKQRKQLVQDKKIRKLKPLLSIQKEDLPYTIPEGWEWVKLGQITTKLTDGSHNPPKNNGSGFPMLSSQNVNFGTIDFSNPSRYVNEDDFEKEDKRTQASSGDVLLTIVASLGRSAVVPENAPKFVLQRSVAVISAPIDSDFLCQQFSSSLCTNYYSKYAKGTAQKGIYLGKLAEMPIVLPPLSEQHRIVAKIDQLMARCDELEKLREARDRTRIKVHMAACDRLLTAPDTDTFTQSWQFITKHFSELYSVKENVAELRKAILQMAVMGKLVPQNVNDSSASELLKEIEVKRQRLLREKKIKRTKPLPELALEDIPYQLPENWLWVRLGTVTSKITDGDHKTPPRIEEGYRLLSAKNVRDGFLNFDNCDRISEESYLKSRERCCPEHNDLLIVSVGGTIGRSSLVPKDSDFALVRSVALIKPLLINSAYLKYAMDSSLLQNSIHQNKRGGAQPCLYLSEIQKFMFSLPPISEQSRIVEKLNRLMTLCDTLEQQIDATTQKQTALLNAVTSKI